MRSVASGAFSLGGRTCRDGWTSTQGRQRGRSKSTIVRRPHRPRRVGPFLKEYVKGKQFSFGLVRTDSARCTLPVLLVRCPDAFCAVAVVSFLAFVSVVVATGSCNRSFQRRLLPTHSFARYRSRETRAALPGNGPGQMRTYLVRIPHRQDHSIQSNVLLASTLAGPKPPHPRSDSRWPKREASQVAPGQLRPNNRPEARFLMTPLRFC